MLDSVNIDWEYSLPNGNNWSPAGQSDNHIYLTYKPMTATGKKFVSPKLQTVFQDATRLEPFDDSGSPMNLLSSVIWPHFSSLSATRAIDGAALYYYKNWNIERGITFLDLVSGSDGTCGAWCQLLAAAILADGLDSTLTVRDDDVEPVRSFNYYGFLVNNWEFTAGKAKTNVNYFDVTNYTKDNRYNWLDKPQAPQAKDLPGIKGQNVSNPKANFKDHCLVEVDSSQTQVSLYDPSYGQIYEGAGANTNVARSDALKKFQDAAIAGFYTWIMPPAGDPDKWDITPNNNLPLRVKTDPKPFGGS